MAADGDGLEIFRDGLEMFVVDVANGADEFPAIYHLLQSFSHQFFLFNHLWVLKKVETLWVLNHRHVPFICKS